MLSKNKERKAETKFDAYFSPRNSVNRQAAGEKNLIYDEEKGFYVDEDGCLIRDRFGQEL